MRCPFCWHDNTQVVDSRVSEDGTTIRRRRRCPACDKRFTTYERVELALPTVIKSDGTRVEFDRSKMLSSIQLALRKRPVAAEKIDAVVARIEYQLLASGEREVRSKWFGELVMEELLKLDEIAYVRFASVYRRFEDVSEFKKLIDEFGWSSAAGIRS
ncbi:transcriptional regulator NrdR [Candidatus Vallotia lariciata]|uniref:transcriptional regulator NrdR n=1 Tax=Candidatus Vallotia laricis TaxID=2018052 RepID=UPI001D017A7A|nr:transcriptional regulator NrdR [Candidatus Vallotia lariciata]UDG82974.1 Transcriptional repressor NrdR [Candidatus Vallotia lariciata]